MTTQYNRDIPGARFARGATGMIPLRLDGAPSDGPFRGQTLFRGVRRTEPGELCRAFGIAEVGFRWELGPGLRGISGDNFARRSDSTASMDGYLFANGHEAPIAKIRLAKESERFRDWDPTSRRDFERLDQ